MNAASSRAFELNVLRVGLARNSRDQLMLKLDTADVHAIACIVPREEVQPMIDRPERFDELPLLRLA